MESQNAMWLIIGLIIAIGIGTTALIFMTTISGTVYDLTEDDINSIATNEVKSDSFIASNLSKANLDHSFVQTGTLTVKNGTANGNEVGLGNFTIDYGSGTVLLKTTATYGTYNGSTMYANYTWGIAEIRSHITDSVLSGFEAQEKTAKFMPLIILAIVIAIVLMVLPFWGNKGGGQQSSL